MSELSQTRTAGLLVTAERKLPLEPARFYRANVEILG